MPFARYCDRQSTSHALYLRRFAFARTQPDKLVYLHPDCQPTHTAMRPLSSFRTLCSRIYAISPQKPIHARFCCRTAVRRPAPTLSAPSIPASGAGERISLCSRFMWNIRLVIRQNLNVYRGFCSFMHIYTLRHCMFFAYPFAFPSLRSFPCCRSAAGDRASAPLRRFVSEPRIAARIAVFVGARLHSVFARSCLPLFLISRSLFASCSMAYRKLFVCFSLPSAFRASLRGSAPHLRPSLIRPHIKRSPLPNLSILLDTVLLLLYNYLAFACESPLFVYYWLYKATRSDRPSAVRSVEQRHKTTTK